MKFSIVIPTWNAANDVRRVLTALLPLELPGEILIVDNGVVNDETEHVAAEFREQFPYVKYLKFEKQLGYAGAVNAGVKAASHRFVAVMNNDNLPQAGWLKALAEEMQASPTTAIVSANVERLGVPQDREGGLSIFGRIVYTEKRKPNGAHDVFQPDGSAFLLDREKISLPYEDEYFIYQEDAALGWKARLMGFNVRHATEAKVTTFDGGSTRRIPYKTAFFSERNRWLNYLAFPELGTVVRCLPIWALDSLASAVRGNLRARLHAWFWIAAHFSYVLGLRKRMQALRIVSDDKILPLLFGRYLSAFDPLLFSYFRLVGLELRR
jgi:GT2 family glycosyltransferase